MRLFFRLDRIGLVPALAVTSAVLVLTLTFAVLHLIGASAVSLVEKEIGQSLADLAIQTADKLDQGLLERRREVELMAERPDIVARSVAAFEKRRVLERIQASYPHYAWIGLTDRAGSVLVSTGGLLEGVDVSGRPWFGAAQRGQRLSDVHEAVLLARLLSRSGGEPERFP